MTHSQKIIELYKNGKVSDATMVKMAAFKNEIETIFNSNTLEKTAVLFPGGYVKGSKQLIKQLPDWAKIVLGMGIAAPATALGDFMIGKSIDRGYKAFKNVDFTKKFEEMLNLRPELKSEDQIILKRYWDSLIKFAPVIAEDPLAAGAYLKQAIEYEAVGGPPYSVIDSLVKLQKTYKETNPLSGANLGESIANVAPKFQNFKV